jgi:hypothetical protein
VTGDFNFWLIIVGLIAGAALTWLVMAETTRRDQDIAERELEAEAGWIANTLGDPLVDAEVAEHVLRAHRRYLGFPPPDALVDPDELVALPQDDAPADTPGDSGETAPAPDSTQG